MDEQIELPCDHCGKTRYQHVAIVGAGPVCPISAVTFSNSKSARIAALAGTIAELTEALETARTMLKCGLEPRRSMAEQNLVINRAITRIDAALAPPRHD